VSDAIYALGDVLGCETPGSSTCVAQALVDLGCAHLILDARYASVEVVVALHGTVSLLASQLIWWAAVNRSVELSNHVECPEPWPNIPEGDYTALEAAAWLPGSSRTKMAIPDELHLPDAEGGLLRSDLVERIRAEPQRSVSALADAAIHGHTDLFSLAMGTPHTSFRPIDLFGLRFIAEAATDANVACLAAASAARIRLRIGQATDALERLDQAMSRTQYADPVHRALLIWAEALVQQEIGDESAAIARFEEAVVIVHNQRDLALLATLHRQWAEVLAERGRSEFAAHHFRLARGLYRQQGNVEGLSAALRGAAELAVMGQETISAEALFDQAEMTTTSDIEQANRLLGQVGLAIVQHSWERARRLLKRIERIGLQHPLALANLHRRLADVAFRSGDLVNASRESDTARGWYERAGKKASAARCVRLQGDVEALQNNLESALKLYRRAAHMHIRTGDWIGMHRTISHAREICDPDSAARLSRLSTELMMFGSAR